VTRPRIGVLALQGDVREHSRTLAGLGADVVLVRRPEDLAAVVGLVLPGGESSVIDKLSRAFGMRDPIRTAIADGMPVLGTCAGLILLADRLEDGIAGQQTFGGLDVTVRRNAFGSQADSFETDIDAPVVGEPRVRATFIRAPIVSEVGPSAEVIARLPGGGVVGVRQGRVVGLSFHPELDGETRFHELLLDSARDA